jgi:hypothetical protein
MQLSQRLELLQRQLATQVSNKVDLYYYEGYGALAVPHGAPLHPRHVIFAFPDIAIRMEVTR